MSRSFVKWFLVCVLMAAVPLCGCRRISRWLEGEPESHRTYRVANELFEDKNFQEAAVAYRSWLADYHDKQDVMRPFVV